MPLSKEELKKLAAKPDSEIDYSDIPELDEEWFKDAKIVYPKNKKPISLRVDQDMYEWYKKQSNGNGFQSLMHAVLRTYMSAQKDKR